MSKSFGNVTNPDDIVREFGADALRMYEMFIAPFDQMVPWNARGVVGVYRFLEKVWKLALRLPRRSAPRNDNELERLLHRTIKKVSEDIAAMKFNTAVSALMILANEFSTGSNSIKPDCLETFLKLLAPFAPHLTEEMWQKLGHKTSIHLEKWPEYDSKLIREESISLPVQINGKVRATIQVPVDITEDEVKELAQKDENVSKYLAEKSIRKIIYVKGKIINFVINSDWH
ncbi:hypothetical protein D4R52_03055 [bacterium]|nr:MAG: hypothetical protein D4R52_03055 [bacterium]